MMIAALLFLFIWSCADLYRRVTGGRYSPNLFSIVSAPQQRKEQTDSLLQSLGAQPSGSIKYAVTEIQVRYSVDDRITILSLDGRASGRILNYIDRNTGFPDFGRYLEDGKPDFIELGQFCVGGYWLPPLFPIIFSSEFDVRVGEKGGCGVSG